MKLKLQHIIGIAIILFIVGAFLYYQLFWESLTPWILDDILMPITMQLFKNVELNILTGFLLTLVGMAFLYLLFFIPYIVVFWLVSACILIIIKHPRKKTLP
ncbi:large-conductance mechanosensitive channel [Breznakia sp. PF5-3]|uniref:hypothetical protein n=1 Tax=unclassified Breznakia TaxID=2623764 RepID=UPI002404DFCA|nr:MULTISPECIES: hypothetical protein [unclassified Breznakia]MDF9825772.1 large-conductance mechanosensitive channel [Breznakia sp. PM6-1]MDF9836577.1 large-conductance mechanosensitive channel [Breznakia sp. PF5-3]MDF9838816.1 large-conductance mechanosensitive channel [Breznakia sp. PFB2-8]MDF9860850.1 large-conductance mechanosensitive channel [Breznakia sp. PH5-24]